jgi:plastocyanin
MTKLFVVSALVALASTAQAQPVAVTLSEFALKLSRDTVKAGKVSFAIKNDGRTTHAIRVVGGKIDKGSRELAKAEAATLQLELTPGTYEVYCPLAEGSHKMAGMKHTLVVVAAAADAKAAKKPH